MIQRQAFLQITKAMIMGLRNALTDPSVCIKQNIIEELARILEVKRCVIFGIYKEALDGMTRDICELVAGVPFEEYRSYLRKREPLESHPDIEAVVHGGRISVIKDPKTNQLTAYFKDMVDKKDISEIVYIPLFADEDREAVGVIVIDAVMDRKFSDDEILFCSEVAELVSLMLGQERALLQHFRHAIINRVLPLGGFAARLRSNLQTTLEYMEIIQKEAVEISSVIPNKFSGGLWSV